MNWCSGPVEWPVHSNSVRGGYGHKTRRFPLPLYRLFAGSCQRSGRLRRRWCYRPRWRHAGLWSFPPWLHGSCSPAWRRFFPPRCTRCSTPIRLPFHHQTALKDDEAAASVRAHSRSGRHKTRQLRFSAGRRWQSGTRYPPPTAGVRQTSGRPHRTASPVHGPGIRF